MMSAAEYEITNKELNMLNMVLGRRDNFFFFLFTVFAVF